MIKAYAATEAGGELKPFEYDPGPLAHDEVEINVEHCGICHSDLSMLNNDWGLSEFPFVPGHEVVGIIAAVGPGVTHLQVGQRVGLGWHAGYCMSCNQCMSGDHNLCGNSTGTIVSHHGGFAEQVRAQAASVVPVPDALDPAAAAPLFCGGITVFNPLIQYQVKPTDHVAVIGIGGLGHLAIQFLKAWGCEVTAFTTSESKKQEAMDMGAHHTLNTRDPEALAAAAGRFDMVMSTVNVKLDWEAYVNTLKPRGRFHFLGATLEPIELGAFSLIMAQRDVSGSPVGSPENIRKMLEFAAQHNIQAITETFAFEDVNQALAHLESGKARYRVVLSHSQQ